MRRKKVVLSIAQENARRRNWIKGQIIGMVTRLENILNDDKDVLHRVDWDNILTAKNALEAIEKVWKDKL